MGYMSSWNANELTDLGTDLENLDALAPEQMLEDLQLNPAEQAELDAE
ncbi:MULTISPECIES: hypothetical protein [Pseudomonas]|jgi:hypothetical protein|nr:MULTISPECIES: hypothetical protein [Pseudomonas]